MTLWSPQQDAALRAVDDWYRNHRKTQQIFRLFGWAGTGKTTLAKHFAEGVQGQVKFACYTGKAAHVMASKGCLGASTLHKLIYRPKMQSKNHLKDLEKQLSDHEASPEPNKEVIKRIREEIKKEQENVGRMNFSLNLESELKFAKLLIVDEISMLDERMGKDLESFGVPILVLGDPEQLPPIYGEGYFTKSKPDIMLSEIHRQAEGNPIIHMSRLVREGKPLPLGQYGESKVVDTKLESDDVLSNDIILTGLRATKRSSDIRCRELLGKATRYPLAGDSVMCVKNNHNLGLLNGQIYEMVSDSVLYEDIGTINLHIRNPDDGVEMNVLASEKLFRGLKIERFEHEEDVDEFEYAYAITVHKAQGSQWNNVLLFDQAHRFKNYSAIDRRRWLYTGITRAAERITVMRL